MTVSDYACAASPIRDRRGRARAASTFRARVRRGAEGQEGRGRRKQELWGKGRGRLRRYHLSRAGPEEDKTLMAAEAGLILIRPSPGGDALGDPVRLGHSVGVGHSVL